jgi:arsenate reductase (thioredoxin)
MHQARLASLVLRSYTIWQGGYMKILFMCVANSARSQMAEGLAKSLAGPGIKIQSAGSKATHINPLAIQAMKEIGIDITSQKSKSVADIDPETVDTVITLCAEEVCPVYIGQAKRFHWPFPDPANKNMDSEKQLQLFRSVRDSIQKKLKTFFDIRGCLGEASNYTRN